MAALNMGTVTRWLAFGAVCLAGLAVAGLTSERGVSAASACAPGYSPCLPVTGDLNCSDIPDSKKPIRVTGRDQYELDRDDDGVACELDGGGSGGSGGSGPMPTRNCFTYSRLRTAFPSAKDAQYERRTAVRRARPPSALAAGLCSGARATYRDRGGPTLDASMYSFRTADQARVAFARSCPATQCRRSNAGGSFGRVRYREGARATSVVCMRPHNGMASSSSSRRVRGPSSTGSHTR
jgi:hypothetical protein